MSNEGPDLYSVSPGRLRRAELCPRIMVHDVQSGRKTQIASGGGEVVNGNFFHSHIAEPIFRDLAGMRQPNLRAIFLKNGHDHANLAIELWREFIQNYLARYVSPATYLGNNPIEQITAFNHGLRAFAEWLADHHAQRAARAQPVFVPPEEPLEREVIDGPETLTLRGTYDGLLYDRQQQRYTVVDFKCKSDGEVDADFQQLAAYAYLIGEISRLPVGGALIYVQMTPDVIEYSPVELKEATRSSEERVRLVSRWLRRKDGEPPVPSTKLEGLCARCSLRSRCEEKFGPKTTSQAA